MNGQYFGEHTNPPDMVEQPDKDSDTPIVNLDPFDNKAPVDAALIIHETAVVETVAAVRPMDETIVHEAPVIEAIPYKAPVSGTIVDEAELSRSIPYKPPMGETITHEAPIGTSTGSPASLLNHEESEHFRTRWNEIQGKFVDEPRSAVQQADALVSEVIEQITQMFAKEHSLLEGQWKQGNDVSTEDLRKALQRYRSFFNRLVV